MLWFVGEANGIHDAIYQTSGISQIALVITPAGNVVEDTSISYLAQMHKRLLQSVDKGKTKYIIVTHSHEDHVWGVKTWKELCTEVIVHENSVKSVHYQCRLSKLFSRRNAAQFNVPLPLRDSFGNHGGENPATIIVKKRHHFQLSGLTFEVYHTPGETDDHLFIWIPEYKAAFVGDNDYRLFPNLYSLRGTKPRWALDYVQSLDRVISWDPEILISGQSPLLHGKKRIAEELICYRNAILFVHDATVKGMNDGKDVHSLMREISFRLTMSIPEVYGSVAWSVRGIFEGYIGWFDGNPANMYSDPISVAFPDVVKLAGGSDAVAERSRELINDGEVLKGLHLCDMVLSVDRTHVGALPC